jgi:hypothetical protein
MLNSHSFPRERGGDAVAVPGEKLVAALDEEET